MEECVGERLGVLATTISGEASGFGAEWPRLSSCGCVWGCCRRNTDGRAQTARLPETSPRPMASLAFELKSRVAESALRPQAHLKDVPVSLRVSC